MSVKDRAHDAMIAKSRHPSRCAATLSFRRARLETGMALSKQEYLTAVESGDLDYRTFEAAKDIACACSGRP